jgi:trehalose 6-phosphate synthase/phosphatase
MDRTPLSILEEKDYSISWHYRRCDPDLAFVRVTELKTALMDMTANLDLSILDGNQVIEVKNTSINKGKAASLWLNQENWDFIYAAGDDWTDEDLFAVLPEDAVSIKIGSSFSKAAYYIDSVDEHLGFLSDLL